MDWQGLITNIFKKKSILIIKVNPKYFRPSEVKII